MEKRRPLLEITRGVEGERQWEWIYRIMIWQCKCKVNDKEGNWRQRGLFLLRIDGDMVWTTDAYNSSNSEKGVFIKPVMMMMMISEVSTNAWLWYCMRERSKWSICFQSKNTGLKNHSLCSRYTRQPIILLTHYLDFELIGYQWYRNQDTYIIRPE